MQKTNELLFVVSQQLKCGPGFNRNVWSSVRSGSTDKETLMVSIQLPHEHSGSDTEVRPELRRHAQKRREMRKLSDSVK